MIHEPERLNKRRKKWFRTVFHHQSHSAVVLLLTLYSALLWSLPHEGILISTKGDRRWNKSTFRAGFPYWEITGIPHLLDSVIGFRKDPLPRAQGFFFFFLQLFLVADTYEPAAYKSSSLRLRCSACQTGWYKTQTPWCRDQAQYVFLWRRTRQSGWRSLSDHRISVLSTTYWVLSWSICEGFAAPPLSSSKAAANRKNDGGSGLFGGIT